MYKRLRSLAAWVILAGMMFVPLGCGSSSGNGDTGTSVISLVATYRQGEQDRIVEIQNVFVRSRGDNGTGPEKRIDTTDQGVSGGRRIFRSDQWSEFRPGEILSLAFRDHSRDGNGSRVFPGGVVTDGLSARVDGYRNGQLVDGVEITSTHINCFSTVKVKIDSTGRPEVFLPEC